MPKLETPASLRETLWSQMGGDLRWLSSLSMTGSNECLPSVYAVTEFAASTVGLATLGVAEWLVRRQKGGASGGSVSVSVDRDHAALAFRSERYLDRPAKAWPALWDSLAGDYATRDGFIRLHTNYPHHRTAAERVLGSGHDRESAAAQIGQRGAAELEAAVVGEGGCAAALYSAKEWASHPQGRVVLASPSIGRTIAPSSAADAAIRTGRRADVLSDADRSRPLRGLRVLDLTRVIAGPICTRVLAAWGAEVLRIDPTGFEESDPLVADTTVGKRCAALNLREDADRHRFEALLSTADVLVHGYRSDALARLGYDTDTLRAQNPSLIITALDAYGFDGPWRARRGFDSLVQMSCGIAARGQEVFGTQMPKPLPAQALDHGSGYLLAAATCRALCDLDAGLGVSDMHLSLAGTAKALMSLGETGDPTLPEPDERLIESLRFEEDGPFGRLKRIACPGQIDSHKPRWHRPAGPLANDSPTWLDEDAA